MLFLIRKGTPAGVPHKLAQGDRNPHRTVIHSEQDRRSLAALDGACGVERTLRVGTRQDTSSRSIASTRLFILFSFSFLSFHRACGDALHELLVADDEHDHDRDDCRRGRCHHQVVLRRTLFNEARQRKGNRIKSPVGQENQRVKIVVPRPEEDHHCQRRHAGFCHRQHDLAPDGKLARAVDLCRLTHFVRNLREILPHEEGTGDCKDTGQDQRPVCANHTEAVEDDEFGDDRDLRWDHHRRQVQQEHHVAPAELDLCKSITREAAGEDCAGHVDDRDLQRIEISQREVIVYLGIATDVPDFFIVVGIEIIRDPFDWDRRNVQRVLHGRGDHPQKRNDHCKGQTAEQNRKDDAQRHCTGFCLLGAGCQRICHSIALMAQMDGNADIQKMASNFAGLTQARLSGGGDVKIPLAQELQYAKFYIELQQMRFGEKISYQVSVSDEELLTCLVPKLIIEMLVENAVGHGIEPKDGSGTVHVSAGYAENGAIELVVADDGVGFEGQNGEIPLPLDLPVSGNRHNRVALNTVYKIMQHLYGPAYGIHIISYEQIGTTVTIHLPREEITYDQSPDCR